MMSLPLPVDSQAFCKLSALEGGVGHCPAGFLIDPDPGEMTHYPSLCFLLRHSTRPETFVFDLGIHKDWAKHSPELVAMMSQSGAQMQAPQDVSDSLRKGGLDPAEITYVCLSHIHIDHVGDPALFTAATYLVGAGSRDLPSPSTGHTQPFSNALFAALPQERVRYLDPRAWPALGPFPHALDFFGDGSLYVVDAPGHVVGHINVLARTSSTGGWLYLAADSVHDWRILRGEAKVARTPWCAHMHLEEAEAHIANIATLLKENERVRVLLAHDTPWYEENKGGDAFWPGEIPSL